MTPTNKHAPRAGTCRFPDCGRPVHSKGYCQSHRRQLREKGALRPLRRQRKPRPGVVQVGSYRFQPKSAQVLRAEAKRRGVPLTALFAEVLETWVAKRYGKNSERAPS